MDELTAKAPANGYLAPPGYYLLFVLNAQGVQALSSRPRCKRNAAPGKLASLASPPVLYCWHDSI